MSSSPVSMHLPSPSPSPSTAAPAPAPADRKRAVVGGVSVVGVGVGRWKEGQAAEKSGGRTRLSKEELLALRRASRIISEVKSLVDIVSILPLPPVCADPFPEEEFKRIWNEGRLAARTQGAKARGKGTWEKGDDEGEMWANGLSVPESRRVSDDPWDDCDVDATAHGGDLMDLAEMSAKTEKFQIAHKQRVHKVIESEEAGTKNDPVDVLVEMEAEFLQGGDEEKNGVDVSDTFGNSQEETPDAHNQLNSEKSNSSESVFQALRAGASIELSPRTTNQTTTGAKQETNSIESFFKPQLATLPITSSPLGGLDLSLSMGGLARSTDEPVYQSFSTGLDSLFALPPAAVPGPTASAVSSNESRPFAHHISPLMQGLPGPAISSRSTERSQLDAHQQVPVADRTQQFSSFQYNASAVSSGPLGRSQPDAHQQLSGPDMTLTKQFSAFAHISGPLGRTQYDIHQQPAVPDIARAQQSSFDHIGASQYGHIQTRPPPPAAPLLSAFSLPGLYGASNTLTQQSSEAANTPYPARKSEDWYYRDPKGRVQGPFETEKMRQWFEHSYFKPDMPIKLTTWSDFHSLASVFPNSETAFTYQYRVNEPMRLSHPQMQPLAVPRTPADTVVNHTKSMYHPQPTPNPSIVRAQQQPSVSSRAIAPSINPGQVSTPISEQADAHAFAPPPYPHWTAETAFLESQHTSHSSASQVNLSKSAWAPLQAQSRGSAISMREIQQSQAHDHSRTTISSGVEQGTAPQPQLAEVLISEVVSNSILSASVDQHADVAHVTTATPNPRDVPAHSPLEAHPPNEKSRDRKEEAESMKGTVNPNPNVWGAVTAQPARAATLRDIQQEEQLRREKEREREQASDMASQLKNILGVKPGAPAVWGSGAAVSQPTKVHTPSLKEIQEEQERQAAEAARRTASSRSAHILNPSTSQLQPQAPSSGWSSAVSGTHAQDFREIMQQQQQSQSSYTPLPQQAHPQGTASPVAVPRSTGTWAAKAAVGTHSHAPHIWAPPPRPHHNPNPAVDPPLVHSPPPQDDGDSLWSYVGDDAPKARNQTNTPRPVKLQSQGVTVPGISPGIPSSRQAPLPAAKPTPTSARTNSALVFSATKPSPADTSTTPSLVPTTAKPTPTDTRTTSSLAPTASSKSKAGGNGFGGKEMPPEMARWCASQLTALNHSDLALAQFCMSLESGVEIREYFAAYLGSTPQVSAFATEFIQRKDALRHGSGSGLVLNHTDEAKKKKKRK